MGKKKDKETNSENPHEETESVDKQASHDNDESSKDLKKKEKEAKKQAELQKKQEKKLQEQKKKEEKKNEKEIRKRSHTTTAVPQRSMTESTSLPPMPEAAELNKMFSQLLEDLDVPKDKRENMMKDYSNQMKWSFLYQHKLKLDSAKRSLSQENDNSSDSDSKKEDRNHQSIKNTPQYFISKLQSGEADLDCLISLRVSLSTEPIIWMNKFREIKGIPALSKLIQELEKKTNKTKTDIEFLYQCVLCIKVIMNNKYGLKEVIETPDALNRMILCLDISHPKMKIALFEIFSTVCVVFGQQGHSLSVDSMTYYKFVKREPARFAHLVEVLKYRKTENQPQNIELWVNCLTFINCLINIPDSLATRVEIRSEFLRLSIKEIIEELESKEKNMPEELSTQIKIFQDHLQADEQEFVERFERRKIRLDDPQDIFKNLNEIVSSLSYLRRPFISILRNLVSFPPDVETGLKCWMLCDKFIEQVSLQKEKIAIGEEQLDTDELMAAVEDKAELQVLKEKYDDLETELQEEKSAHGHTLKTKTAEIEKLRKKVEKYKAKKTEGSSEDAQTLKQQMAALKEENERLKQGQGLATGGSQSSDTASILPSDATPIVPPPPPGMDIPPPPPPSFAPPPPPPPPGMEGGPPPPPGFGPPPPLPGFGGSTLPKGLSKINVPKPKGPVKNLNWTKIPNNKIEGTIFTDVAKGELKLDFSEIEALFSKKVVEKKVVDEKPKKPLAVTVIDGRRSQNVGIFLNTMKMQPSEIYNLIIRLDEKYLDLDTSLRLLDNTPNSDDISAIKNYLEKGDASLLANVEKYFLQVDTIPMLKNRLRAVVFKLSFPSKVEDIQPVLIRVKEASKQVKKSKKLLKIIKVILLIGNFLNGGTARGDAFGFKINSLLKLVETKTYDNKSSLMHYLVKLVKEKMPEEDMVGFEQEIPTVIEAAKVNWSNTMSELAELKKNLKQVEADIKQIPKMEGVDDVFHKLMPKSIRKCAIEFDSLEDLMNEAQKDFESTAEAFGEAKQIPPEQFFESLSQFVQLFDKTVREIEDAKIKEEKARKRAEEEERKAKKKEEKMREKEEREKERSLKGGQSRGVEEQLAASKEDGVVDNALAALRGGQAFKKDRKRVEENVLSSVMGTLSSLSSGKKMDSAEGKTPANESSFTQPKQQRNDDTNKEETTSNVSSSQNGTSQGKQSDSANSSQPKLEETSSSETGEDSLETRRRRREERRKQREEEERREQEEAERKREERRKRLDALKANS
mmetsp:Transcript_26457/g.37250  ORF Transcript_26457/g.37250 Transcript_26457/m.37250 type:complete len:1253 (+) Transcript_26457:69-3827(+)